MKKRLPRLTKAGYYSGLRNAGYNPVSHIGGKEFRDPLSVDCETSFHFKVLYPKYEQRLVGFTIRDHPILKTVRLPGPTWATDVHIDVDSPLNGRGALLRHTRQVSGQVWELVRESLVQSET